MRKEYDETAFHVHVHVHVLVHAIPDDAVAVVDVQGTEMDETNSHHAKAETTMDC